MSLYLRSDRNSEFFNEFSHELAEVQSKYKDITLAYKYFKVSWHRV